MTDQAERSQDRLLPGVARPAPLTPAVRSDAGPPDLSHSAALGAATYEVMELSADPGLSLVAYSTEEGSPDDHALRLLASWAATHEPADALAADD